MEFGFVHFFFGFDPLFTSGVGLAHQRWTKVYVYIEKEFSLVNQTTKRGGRGTSLGV